MVYAKTITSYLVAPSKGNEGGVEGGGGGEGGSSDRVFILVVSRTDGLEDVWKGVSSSGDCVSVCG